MNNSNEQQQYIASILAQVFVRPGKEDPPFTKMDQTELKNLKQKATPCFACFCVEWSCVDFFAEGVCCAVAGKVCCCTGSVGCDCGSCCHCQTASCYTQEQGCCEVSQKMGCCYTELQFPPGRDIGCGFCGFGCCRTSDDAPADELAQTMTANTDDPPVE